MISSKTKVEIAAAMMFLVVVSAPAFLCLSYLAHSTQTHGCCPPKTAPVSTVVPTCCIQSPAIISQNIDVAFDVATVPMVAAKPLPVAAGVDSPAVLPLDTSPPIGSSVLRI